MGPLTLFWHDVALTGGNRASRPVGPPAVLEGPLLDYPDSSELRLVKLSNILGIETRPFDPAAFEREVCSLLL